MRKLKFGGSESQRFSGRGREHQRQAVEQRCVPQSMASARTRSTMALPGSVGCIRSIRYAAVARTGS